MSWLPVLKASLPYLTQLVSAAIPAFTSRQGNERGDAVVARQIEELQTAATHNAESIRMLAERLQQSLQGVESAVVEMERKAARLRWLALAASGIAILALALAGLALAR